MAEEKLSPLGSELMAALKEVKAHRRGEIELPTRVWQGARKVDVAALRKRLHLSQREFAERFGLALSTVRGWERGRHQPDRSARVLLRVIEREGEAVVRALGA